MIFFAETIPDGILHEKGFIDWVVYLLAFLFVVKVVRDWFVPPERKISGTLDTKPAVQHADKGALDALADTVNAMREENAAMHRNAQTEGQNRVMAITQDVNAEMSAMTSKIGDLAKMITTALIDNGTQSEAINNIKARMHSQEQNTASVHRRIDEILQQGRKRTSS